MKKKIFYALLMMLLLPLALTGCSDESGPSVDDDNQEEKPVDNTSIVVEEANGYLESAYIKWQGIPNITDYVVQYKKASDDDSAYVKVNEKLIREYNDYYRADIVGLAKGEYNIRISPVGNDASLDYSVTENVVVDEYDRSGFAFSSNSLGKTASGAYNDDGTLKANAQVIYVTKNTAKTCQATVNGKVVKGLQAILTAKQKKEAISDILDIRIVGKITKSDLDSIGSESEGLQIKGSKGFQEMNITIEGIGEDATIDGFGFLVRNSCNVEFRNFAIMNFMDDGISLDTENSNIWIHNMDLFYGQAGSDADQVKGDGSIDIKAKSTYITISYVHFWDSGKASLCGMSDTEEFMVTYHHNWFDHSDSRHPRIRVATAHIYNNYFDGQAKYGIGVTKGSSAFVEANSFRNCKNPMISSKQGTDLLGDGTLSGEDGGMIKAYNNKVVGEKSLIYINKENKDTITSFDAYNAVTKDEKVPDTILTLKGQTSYNNFDTDENYDLGVKESSIDAVENVEEVVTKYAGRLNGGDLKWEFNDSIDDESYQINSGLRDLINNYQSKIIRIFGDDDIIDEPEETTNEIKGPTTHNFSEKLVESDVFVIVGNMKSGTFNIIYDGVTYTKGFKMEGDTSITFTLAVSLKLTLVTDGVGKKIVVDGKKYTVSENGTVVIDLEAGSHLIKKGDSMNLFAIILS